MNVKETLSGIGMDLHKKYHEIKCRIGSGIIESRYRINIDERSLHRLEAVREFLSTHPDYNLFLYFNDLAFSNPVIASKFYRDSVDPEMARLGILPVGDLYMRFDKPPHTVESIGVRILYRLYAYGLSHFLDLEKIRLIQGYMRPSNGQEISDFDYTPEEVYKSDKFFLKKLIKYKEDKKKITIVFAPEGHRSDDGTLQQGEDGAVNMGKILSPAIFLAVGMVYEGQYDRNSLNLGHEVNLIVGLPIRVDNRENAPTLEKIMKPLAKTLPAKMRGYYE